MPNTYLRGRQHHPHRVPRAAVMRACFEIVITQVIPALPPALHIAGRGKRARMKLAARHRRDFGLREPQIDRR